MSSSAEGDGSGWSTLASINGYPIYRHLPDRLRDVGEHFDWRSPDAWHFMEVPERQWVIEGWLPRGQVALLTGEGGAGKSLLAQQFSTCVAFEQPFMGLCVPRGMNAVYLTCEDDFEELHRRQVAICRALGVGMDHSDGRLFLVSLRGTDQTELMGPDLLLTSVFERLRKTVELLCHHGVLVLDNVAHLFGGNENDRHQVATFFHAIDGLAMENDCTIILLGHPPKSGAQFSGSTAWENQVRTRLYLTRSDQDDAFEDADARILTRSKSNYARGGERLSIRWRDWAFVIDEDDRSSWSESLSLSAAAAKENERFLQCLDKAAEQGRALSHSPHAGNYAPKVMHGMPAGRGMPKDGFRRAMERLLELGTIVASAELWRDAKRMPVTGIARAARSPSGSPEPTGKHDQAIDSPCRSVVPPGSPPGSPEPSGNASQPIDYACRSVAARSPAGLGGSVREEKPPLGVSSSRLDTDPFEISDDDLEPM